MKIPLQPFIACGISVLAVTVGGVIYLLWRPYHIYFIMLMDQWGMGPYLEAVRTFAAGARNYLPDWVVFALPNGLWAFGYSVLISYLWWKRRTLPAYVWLASIPAVGLGYELLQFMHIIPGVFCYQDLIACVAGITLGTVIGFRIRRSEMYQSIENAN